jgi:hypothetical protein
MGGQLLGRLWPRDDGERQAAIDAGYDLDKGSHSRRPLLQRGCLLLRVQARHDRAKLRAIIGERYG